MGATALVVSWVLGKLGEKAGEWMAEYKNKDEAGRASFLNDKLASMKMTGMSSTESKSLMERAKDLMKEGAHEGVHFAAEEGVAHLLHATPAVGPAYAFIKSYVHTDDALVSDGLETLSEEELLAFEKQLYANCKSKGLFKANCRNRADHLMCQVRSRTCRRKPSGGGGSAEAGLVYVSSMERHPEAREFHSFSPIEKIDPCTDAFAVCPMVPRAPCLGDSCPL